MILVVLYKREVQITKEMGFDQWVSRERPQFILYLLILTCFESVKLLLLRGGAFGSTS